MVIPLTSDSDVYGLAVDFILIPFRGSRMLAKMRAHVRAGLRESLSKGSSRDNNIIRISIWDRMEAVPCACWLHAALARCIR